MNRVSVEPVAWHSALCFAITGVWFDDLGVQPAPDLDRVEQLIMQRTPGGEQAIEADIARRQRLGLAWPYPLSDLPDDLPHDVAASIRPAQWLAAAGALRQRFGLDRAGCHRLRSERQPDADELRLLRELPPHHGTG